VVMSALLVVSISNTGCNRVHTTARFVLSTKKGPIYSASYRKITYT
jgi:hypothetical protein